MRKKKNKQFKTMDFILVLVGISAALFTIIMIGLFIVYQEIPDTLCERFYTCIIGECGVMGVMQIFKTKYKKQNSEIEETEEESGEDADG